MMDENNTDAIYEFGKDIIIEARDNTICGMKNFLSGTAVSKAEKKILEEIKKMNLDEQKRKIIMLLIVDGIDAMMHKLFVNFEESLEKCKIVTKDKKGNDFDIIAESGGLPYGYLEFIDEFSKYKSVDDTIRKIVYKRISDNPKIVRDIIEEYLPIEEWKLEKD